MIRRSFLQSLKNTGLLLAALGVLSVALPAATAQAGLLDFLSSKKAEKTQKGAAPAAPVQAPAPASAPAATPAPMAADPSAAAPAPAAAAPAKPIKPSGKAVKLNTPKEINADQLNKMMSSSNPPYIIDVREPVEFMEFHVNGAVNIPLGSLGGAAANLPKDRDIVVYCRTGRRSEIAQKALNESGVPNVANLMGGVYVWATQNKCDLKKKVC